MLPKKDNKRGFFENLDIFKINEKILRSFDFEWDSVKKFPKNWLKIKRF